MLFAFSHILGVLFLILHFPLPPLWQSASVRRRSFYAHRPAQHHTGLCMAGLRFDVTQRCRRVTPWEARSSELRNLRPTHARLVAGAGCNSLHAVQHAALRRYLSFVRSLREVSRTHHVCLFRLHRRSRSLDAVPHTCSVRLA
jgi:hypothetical protein